MTSKWRKARLAFGCVQIPQTLDDHNTNLHPSSSSPRRLSDVSTVISHSNSSNSVRSPLTPTPSSSGLRLSRSKSKSKKTCAICLSIMIPGQGHAIFTAECSHSFHFNCITSNVNHGNKICPVCRAKWKEVPLQSENPKLPSNSIGLSRNDPWMAALPLQHLPFTQPYNSSSISHVPEPHTFDDDEIIEQQETSSTSSDQSVLPVTCATNIKEKFVIKIFPEVPAMPKASVFDNFCVLIHLKAPVAKNQDCIPSNVSTNNTRAPVDLVTVLDVSGSMAGTKLALLKRAMGFVIQHLGPHDRLSVVAFSSNARRIFPLRKMTDIGRQHALQAVNSLFSNGGTNIAEGLRKGAKVMLDRKSMNPVSSIILLSDGQDTYTAHLRNNYDILLPVTIPGTNSQIPVHSFGFGTDHDSVSMHAIAEASGGTFSFIEAENVIQDAFAQCMGGLLSVVLQELKVEVECVYPNLQLGSIKTGSYQTRMMPGGRTGHINVGDLYAEEERDFLVTLNVPQALNNENEMTLFQVGYSYKDPISKEVVVENRAQEVKIERPMNIPGEVEVSMEVDRQRNRLKVAEAISGAKSAAERGELMEAVSILRECGKALGESVSGQGGDPLCVTLDNELKEIQERMRNHEVYESSGRAYVLSGLSSHSWQRATTRWDTTSSTNLSQAYQTSTMAHMINRSQTMVLGSNLSPPPVRPPRSLSGRLQPR